jgi:hypothetical protein
MKRILDPKTIRAKWGIPDWRDGSAYPTPEKMSDRAWRWEFLRRRDDYRRDWEKKNAVDAKSKYGTTMMVDPAAADGFIRFQTPYWIGYGETVSATMALALDPRASDEEHYNALKMALAYMHRHFSFKEMSKAQRNKWPLYLRALDAETENPLISNSELCNVLFPMNNRGRRKGEEVLKAAKSAQTLLTRPIY